MSIGGMVVLAVAIEAAAVLILVFAVALLGPSDPIAAQAYAERLGYWLGPVAGFVLCLGGGWLVARPLVDRHIARGALLGVMVAAMDVALLIGSGAPFQPILAISNLGRVVAASLGGVVAGGAVRRSGRRAP